MRARRREPAYTIVKAQMPQIRSIDLNIATTWKEFSAGRHGRRRAGRSRHPHPAGAVGGGSAL